MAQPTDGDSSRYAESLHKHSVWVLSTLISLSIREALLTAPQIPGYQDPAGFALHLARLSLVLATAIAFLFGAARYLDELHLRAVKNQSDLNHYVIDFVSSILHFAILFVLSTTCTAALAGGKLSPFLGWLCLFLIYDLFWLWLSRSARSSHLGRHWAVGNTILLLLVLAIYFGLKSFGLDERVSETWALLPVIPYRILDIRQTLTGQPPLGFLKRLLD